MNTPFVIEAQGLEKRFGAVEAVRGIDLQVRRGEIFGFLGPNGAGKSTTINMLCTLLRPTAGRASVAGYDVASQPNEVRARLGLVFQDPSLDVQLTARENLEFHAVLYGVPASGRAARIAEAVNGNPNISVDVGQIAFGQTVSASGDTMIQYRNYPFARPRKWINMDIECDAGCGVVPFLYRERSFVNALQWAIGLELFLLIEDPWRVFLTTDHPNGAPFTTYPHLIRLLMDRSFRESVLDTISPAAASGEETV